MNIELKNSSVSVEKIRHLSELKVFQVLSMRDLEELDRITTISAVAKGHIFYRPEELGEALFILKEGRVQLYRINPDGKKLVIATLGTDALFGQIALSGPTLHNTFAEAVEDCLICVMSRPDLLRLIQSKPQLALQMINITGKRLHEAEAQLGIMAFKGIPARIANHLLRLAEEQSSQNITGLTHQDFAENVGTYRETATQILNDLRSDGYIEIGRKRITIVQKDELALMAAR